jgi:hypothetical protein
MNSKKLITYAIIVVMLAGIFWLVNKYYLADGEGAESVLADIKLDEAEIKKLANIRLDAEIFRDLKFISLREAASIDRPVVVVGNKNIFRDSEENTAVTQ